MRNDISASAVPLVAEYYWLYILNIEKMII